MNGIGFMSEEKQNDHQTNLKAINSCLAKDQSILFDVTTLVVTVHCGAVIRKGLPVDILSDSSFCATLSVEQLRLLRVLSNFVKVLDKERDS